MNKPTNNKLDAVDEIVLATTNAGKINEINEIFKHYANLNIKLSSLKAYNVSEPDEPFETCLENAIHKAKYYAQITKLPTLSEDAGLYIEALDGFPGVRTKDFIVEQGNATNAFNTLQNKLANTTNHRAFFKCAAVIYFPDTQKILSFEADTFGTLTFPARGTTGFGFDPIFIPEGYTQTMAELGEAIKNKISHRALAMNGLLQQL